MLNQLIILDTDEDYLCVLSNRLPGACGIVDFRQLQEMFDGGAYSDTCILTVPADHTDAANVEEGNYLLFQDDDGFWQEYRIVKKERQDGGLVGSLSSYIIAYGEHAFYELNGEILNDTRPTTTSATAAVVEVLTDTRWSIGTAADLGNNSARIYKASVLAGLAKIAKTWGGELRFRLQVVGGEITSRLVDLLDERGADTGKRFEYEKDMIGVVQTVNTENLATALIGRGKGEEIEGEENNDPAYGRRIEFDEVEWSTGDGDPADKPYGQNWIADDAAAASWGPAGRHIYDFVVFDACADDEELLQLTYDELQIRKTPQTSYEMSVVTLEGITNYDHEAVRLGDTVGVINTAISPAVTGEARIIKINKSLIKPWDCALILGNYIPTLTGTTSTLSTQQSMMLGRSGVWDRARAIEENTTGGGALEYTISLLQTQLASTTTNFYTDSNGNFIWENAAQTKALKIGAGILAIANTKSGGEWVWRTFGTGDGFTADEVVSGTLTSDIVFAGELFGARGTFEDLIAGVTGAQRMHMGYSASGDPFIRVYNNANVLSVTITKNGVVFGNDVARHFRYEIGNRVGVGTFVT